VVRTRLAEDTAVEGLTTGHRRYVLLGAGLDSFAWRHPQARTFEVVEVDHPSTQVWKRRRLAARGLGEPPHVRFEPVDLSRSAARLPTGLAPATWSWLGVTMYLDPSAVRRVLRQIAEEPKGSTLVVNFLLAEEALDGRATAVRAASRQTVAEAGEPVRSTYTHRQCEELLAAAGFDAIELLDAEALARRYSTGRPEWRLPATTLIAVARV
jgi:methyltransferase (TIGR00027 family)